MKKGTTHSEESRKKIGESGKGRIPWNKGIIGAQVSFMKGKKRNPEFNLKQSITMKQKYQNGFRVWNKGMRGITKSNSGQFKKGHIAWNKNRNGIYSEQYVKKLRESHMGKYGSSGSNWRGGISFEPYAPTFNRQIKDKIRARDNFICQLCGVPELECRRRLHVHHIDYDKKNCSENNLISLCLGCHVKTNGNRQYWRDYFMKKMEVQDGI